MFEPPFQLLPPICYNPTMNLNITKAITYQFTDKNWLKKTAVHIILPYTAMAMFILTYMAMIFGTVLFEETNETIPLIFGFIFLLTMLVMSLASIIYLMYLNGYTLDIIKTSMKGKFELPEITPIGNRMKEGFKIGLLGAVPMITMYTLMIGAMVILGVVASIEAMPEALALILMFISIIFMILWYIAIFVFAIVIMPAMYFIYIKQGLISAFSLAKIVKVIKVGLAELLIYYGLTMAGSLAIVIFMYIPILGQLLYPITLVIYLFIMSNIYGQLFAEIDKKIKL